MPMALPEDLWQESNPQNPKPDIQNIRVVIHSFFETNRNGTVMTPKNAPCSGYTMRYTIFGKCGAATKPMGRNALYERKFTL